jgi:hypothetical protein
MWILIWLALNGQTIEHYHVGTYKNKDACVKHLSQASVLVTGENQGLECLFIKN